MTRDERSWLDDLRNYGPTRPITIYDRRVAVACFRQDWCAETGDGTGRFWLTSNGKDALDAEELHA